MTVDIEDSIVAIATANGVGMRGIVRLTGPDTVRCVRDLFGIEVSGVAPEQLSVSLVLEDDLLLEGQLLIWPTEKSYTRQPSAEFHTIGSKPLLDLVLQQFCSNGCRIARPGEFTLRAFLGGRLDLTQAEAVLAVIDSTGQQQFEIALQQLAGGLANPLGQIREQLIDLLAELEAGLDFVEEDIEFVTNAQVLEAIDRCLNSVSNIREQIGSRATRESTFEVAMVGWPNVGKSSLFNAMLEMDRAIVANVAGTTRDYLSTNVSRNGLQIQLIDTAGLDTMVANSKDGMDLVSRLASEGSSGEIDAAAQEASLSRVRTANLRLLCLDSNRGLNLFERQLIDGLDPESTLIVLTKCDLTRNIQFDGEYHLTSSVPGKVAGVSSLWDSVCDKLAQSRAGDSEVVGSTLSRCRQHIGEVYHGLAAGKGAALAGVGDEIIAAELRHSLEHLGQIVGTVYTDDILDRIFGRFCIGK